MIASKQSRLLRVLVIDDQPSEMFAANESGFSSHLAIKPVRSWAAAQLIMANEGDLGGADILLVDVSMEKDRDIAKASKVDSGAGVLPAGPLIALPFIGRRAVMSCIVYSSHLANSELQEHPFFLLAMGLITARTEGVGNRGLLSKHLSYGTGPMILDQKIGELVRAAVADSASALKQGLVDYRDRLDTMIDSGAVTVCNREALLDQVQSIKKRLASGQDALIEDDVALAIAGTNWADSIRITSLFADVLGWSGRYATRELIEKLERWIEGLAETSFERALNVIRIQDEAEDSCADDNIVRPDAKEVIDKLYGNLEMKDRAIILRLVVLFANTYALEHPDVKHGGITRQCVYNRLGTGLLQHTYMGWFGERESKTGKTVTRNRTRMNLPHLSTGNDKFERCFLSMDSSVLPEDHEAIIRYRASEGFDEWQSPPYKVMANVNRKRKSEAQRSVRP